MYNLEFAEAHKTFAQYARLQPTDPLGPVSDAAAYLFSEFDRLHILQSEFFVTNNDFFGAKRPDADRKVQEEFNGDLAKASELAEAILKREPADGNALLAQTLRLGLHADYVALIEKRNLAALSEIKQGRELAQKLLSSHPEYFDAYIAEGVENYLLSLKPAPVRWLLHAGGAETDKQFGLNKLKLTAERGHYLRPYAQLLLAVAALRDKDAGRARILLAELATNFPRNQLYRQELAKLR